MLIIFDVVGTLFSFDRLKAAFREQDLPVSLMKLWFSRTLMGGMAATLAGRYVPFAEVAEAALRQAVAQKAKDGVEIEAILRAMRQLEPWEDAEACLTGLRKRGHHIAALTNSGEAALNELIETAGFSRHFDALLSADSTRAMKPHPAPYRFALSRTGTAPADACLVAVHGWDVLGADAVGMRTVWVDRLEQTWPYPGEPPGLRVATLKEVPAAIGRTMPARRSAVAAGTPGRASGSGKGGRGNVRRARTSDAPRPAARATAKSSRRNGK